MNASYFCGGLNEFMRIVRNLCSQFVSIECSHGQTKLEESIKKLRQQLTNRLSSDDGTTAHELRKEVELAFAGNNH